jgi:hypothetical protein
VLVLSYGLGSQVARRNSVGPRRVPVGHSLASAGRLGASAVAGGVHFRSDVSSVGVQGLSREGKVRFAERLVLRGMSMNQTRDIGRKSIPVRDQLSFADKFADAGTDHMDAYDRPARLAY